MNMDIIPETAKNEAKINIAKLLIQQRDTYEYCKRHRNFDKMDEIYKEHYENGGKIIEMLKHYKSFGGNVYDSEISGYSVEKETNYYEIQKIFVEKFGKKVSADSESNSLFINFNSEMFDEMIDFLDNELPSIDYKIEKLEHPFCEGLDNWTDAENFLFEQGITTRQILEYDPIYELTQIIDEITTKLKNSENEKFMNEIEQRFNLALSHLTVKKTLTD